ncbi:6541_t:CDS:2, partial [Funneliformis geosporum]
MLQPAKRKKFKKGVEEYMKVANARDKRDLSKFPGFNFEPIEGTKNQHSIRIGG